MAAPSTGQVGESAVLYYCRQCCCQDSLPPKRLLVRLVLSSQSNSSLTVINIHYWILFNWTLLNLSFCNGLANLQQSCHGKFSNLSPSEIYAVSVSNDVESRNEWWICKASDLVSLKHIGLYSLLTLWKCWLCGVMLYSTKQIHRLSHNWLQERLRQHQRDDVTVTTKWGNNLFYSLSLRMSQFLFFCKRKKWHSDVFSEGFIQYF